MKTIKTLRESTNYWKGVPIGTVIAMLRDDEIDQVADGRDLTSIKKPKRPNIKGRFDDDDDERTVVSLIA